MAKDDDIHDTKSKRYKAMLARHAAERKRRAKVKRKPVAKKRKPVAKRRKPVAKKTNKSKAGTLYKCPDCGWTIKTRAWRIRCSSCGSLNLERQRPSGAWKKADAY